MTLDTLFDSLEYNVSYRFIVYSFIRPPGYRHHPLSPQTLIRPCAPVEQIHL